MGKNAEHVFLSLLLLIFMTQQNANSELHILTPSKNKILGTVLLILASRNKDHADSTVP
jgi:hypothetical protein